MRQASGGKDLVVSIRWDLLARMHAKKNKMPVARPNVKNPEERGGFPEHAAEASGKDLVVSIRW